MKTEPRMHCGLLGSYLPLDFHAFFLRYSSFFLEANLAVDCRQTVAQFCCDGGTPAKPIRRQSSYQRNDLHKPSRTHHTVTAPVCADGRRCLVSDRRSDNTETDWRAATI